MWTCSFSSGKMKSCIFVILLIIYYAECRKVYPTIDKNANLAFINMESGGMQANRPGTVPQPNVAPVPAQKPVVAPPPTATPVPTTVKAVPAAKPAQPSPAQPKPAPNQIKPVSVNPSPAANPITTPGPGSVKQLVNFYDSQGKASPIRPYSYSQAVKQG